MDGTRLCINRWRTRQGMESERAMDTDIHLNFQGDEIHPEMPVCLCAPLDAKYGEGREGGREQGDEMDRERD